MNNSEQQLTHAYVLNTLDTTVIYIHEEWSAGYVSTSTVTAYMGQENIFYFL